MASVPFHYIDLRAFCYATEDEKRVERALMTLLPEDFPIERSETEGHFGDRILVFTARVENADHIRHVLDRVFEADGMAFVRDELDDRVTDDCEFYLTLDKQSAFHGTVERGIGITFRGKIEAYPAKKRIAIENVRPIFTR